MPDFVANRNQTAAYSQLPPELILKIFDIAAASSKSTALALCLVSSWACNLARRRLLDTVTISTKLQMEALLCAVEGPRGDLAAVRHLWLAHNERHDCIIARLPNLADLALTPYSLYHSLWETESPTTPPIPSIAAPDNALRLTVIPSASDGYALTRLLTGANAAQSKLNRAGRNATHLSYALFRKDAYIAMLLRTTVLRVLPTFPHLTHLAVAWPGSRTPLPREALDAFCENALIAVPALRALVVVMSAEARAEYAAEDTAFPSSLCEQCPHVYVVEESQGEPVDMWLEEVRGGDSVWERAARSGATVRIVCALSPLLTAE
ncbi:hypothetical protein PLICRDRAFT_47297 [Plicaturopsis crispa FD-325 SS-3]|uniref:F-box domain-containing protein n=1 Tax=Plicaturopsis crispa FD-325 SS-3 TaxID=944288 RepID=A0A0C9SKA8_PLICR|nr:hypothetical protein PLICRDRAFT_47297 [Plicaturopsis crispa FD-325 SS-3]